VTPSFAVSKDGVRIAYDVTGAGHAVILLHGAGQTRDVWHEASYVTRARDQFTVVTMDIRGHGDSDKPTVAGAYAIDRLTDDILVVADAVGAERFSLWGYSFGGNVGRYLPASSNRVTDLCAKWTPVIDADRSGTLNVSSLADQDRAWWLTGSVPRMVAQFRAILEWPPIEPADLRCPALWLVGTANEQAMPSVDAHRARLAETRVVLHLLPGLTHADELAKPDDVFPPMTRFSRAAAA
jgi:pimeloyl-ACP methyl ester carboxylesterase